MNDQTRESLKQIHERIGKLINIVDGDDTHKKLMSLLGKCYLTDDTGQVVAERVEKVDVTQNWRGEPTVTLHCDSVFCLHRNETLDVMLRKTETVYSVTQVLRLTDPNNSYKTAITEEKFNHIKGVCHILKLGFWNGINDAVAS